MGQATMAFRPMAKRQGISTPPAAPVLAPPNPASHRQGAGGEVAGEHAGATGPNFGELDSGTHQTRRLMTTSFGGRGTPTVARMGGPR
jgi:hypothetical protein